MRLLGPLFGVLLGVAVLRWREWLVEVSVEFGKLPRERQDFQRQLVIGLGIFTIVLSVIGTVILAID